MNAAVRHPLGEDAKACTGCAACAGACPEDCITMQPDAEGFLNPQIVSAACTDCGLCRNICPVSPAEFPAERPQQGQQWLGTPEVFAAWHLDEDIRHKSSSGGVFTALANNILARGGVVVGAAFDDQLVVRHTIIETPADLHRLRGSKYVQSETSSALFRQVRNLLKRESLVLFSGLPCQVAGLRGFLRKDSEKLFCCDLICYGVPSPLLLARYVRYNRMRGNRLVNVTFRDKATGWKHSSVRQHLEGGGSTLTPLPADAYMASYVRNCAMRECCYACKFTNTVRFGDLTIADFWGVAKEYPDYDPDDKGTSLVLANTTKGSAWLEACRESLFLGPADYDTAVAGNQRLVSSIRRPENRDVFYRDVNALSFSALINKYGLLKPHWLLRIPLAIRRRIAAALRTHA